VIELPATALIIAPWRPLRMVGASLQAFLQARRRRRVPKSEQIWGPA